MVELSSNPDLITPENKDKSFLKDLPLSPNFLTILEYYSFIHPTPIQFSSIPLGLQGGNLIAHAKAGTGKTLAFSAIVLERLLIRKKPNIKVVFAGVLVPTRELAIQIHRFINQLGESLSISAGLAIGGLPIQDIKGGLNRKEYDIIVGTLGRITELIKEKTLKLNELEILVLDEADKLLRKENISVLQRILTEIMGSKDKPPQILAFSGTFTPKDYNQLHLMIPEAIELPKRTTPIEKPDLTRESQELNLSTIKQYYTLINTIDKLYLKKAETLIDILQKSSFTQCLVFYNEKARGEELAADLKESGFRVTFIHGDQSQSDRIKVMNKLALMKVQVIISTDLLSRGIDIITVDLVINYDLPKSIETYFHRIGRTGRYGKPGVSLLFISKEEIGFLEKYKGFLSRIEELGIEEAGKVISEGLKGTLVEDKGKDIGKDKGKKKRILEMKGFCYERKLEWKDLKEKVLNEEEFRYFAMENKEFECLECKVCKEFLEKSKGVLGKGNFEIIKYFRC